MLKIYDYDCLSGFRTIKVGFLAALSKSCLCLTPSGVNVLANIHNLVNLKKAQLY